MRRKDVASVVNGLYLALWKHIVPKPGMLENPHKLPTEFKLIRPEIFVLMLFFKFLKWPQIFFWIVPSGGWSTVFQTVPY